ncbi:uncharacterized protein [Drosophila bipectinata]|uniref:uncharacterized protein n=1 Tax=Drosophila bipectinata TaxID=42026 RepID=UPI001C8AD8F4|nr:uncharacterized protein LOC108129653 [Drosophila bipectinata]
MADPRSVRSSQREWCERNSKPKPPFYTPFTRPNPTRWQKPGPMGRDDWANFHKQYQGSSRIEMARQQAGGRVNSNRTVYKKASEPPARGNDSCNVFERLSQPRWQRKKHVPPKKEVFPYRPHIMGRHPPQPEKGRPVRKPKVPCCFQHKDLEIEFWSNIRFPISRKALLAVPRQSILALSKPREYPPPQHCPIPLRPDDMFVPRRNKMTAHQWRLHRQRLEFLAKPNARVLAALGGCHCTKI